MGKWEKFYVMSGKEDWERFKELAEEMTKAAEEKGYTEEQMMQDLKRIRKQLVQEMMQKNQKSED